MKQTFLILIVLLLLLLGASLWTSQRGPGPSLSGTINGTVLLGPICPVMRVPPEPGCDDRPYGAQLVLTTNDGARVVKTFSSGEDGKFSIEAPPGEYAIRSAAATNLHPYCASRETIRVSQGAATETIIYCDTGIR
ncbi:MAG: hypothetical protein Q8Q36_01925 [bacterium]|nr:hypothetical protein [bacterium]